MLGETGAFLIGQSGRAWIPAEGMATCPGCIPPLAHQRLGWAPGFRSDYASTSPIMQKIRRLS